MILRMGASVRNVVASYLEQVASLVREGKVVALNVDWPGGEEFTTRVKVTDPPAVTTTTVTVDPQLAYGALSGSPPG